MSIKTRSHVVRSTHLSTWARLGLVFAVCGMTVFSLEGSAQAANRSTSEPSSHSTAPSSRALSAAICKNVSATSISAIVGHTVPAPTYSSMKEPATKKNFYISGVTGTCEYGKHTTEALISKDVFLVIEITSKPFTTAELKEKVESVKTASKWLHFKIAPYSALGTTAYYFSVSDGGLFGQGISSVSGTTFFGASVETKGISIAKLGSLAKLAEKL